MKSIRSHFVPQFYLRNFGKKFYCYDKTNGKIFKTTPKRIAYETDFYGPVLKDGTQPIETALSELEGKFSVAVSALIETEDFTQLSVEKKLDLLGFFAMQHLRTRERRAGIEDIANSLLQEIVKAKGIDDPTIKIKGNSSLGIQLNLMSDYPVFAAVMAKMKIITVRNNTDIPFWTSDSSVTLQNEIDQFPFGNLGIICKGIELHLPINPKLVLIICDPTVFHPFPNVYDIPKEMVVRENYLQVIHSTRFLISNSDKFHLAKEMLDTNSSAKDPKRKRVSKGIGSEEFENEIKEKPERKLAEKMIFWMDPKEFKAIKGEFDKEFKMKLQKTQ